MSATDRTSARPRKSGLFIGYQTSWLRPDLLAGLTVWAVLIPESLAYATIAGVSPVVGLYAAIPALILYALLGSSRHLVVGPMSATAALSASIATTHSAGDAARFLLVTTSLSLVVGVLGLLAGLCRAGFVASFISEPVLKGFIVGLALTIILGQVPALLGLEKPEAGFFASVWALVTDLPQLHGPTTIVGISALVVLLVLRRLLPAVPSSLIVVLAGIAAVQLWDLEDAGVEVVGTIEPGLPSLGIPGSWELYFDLLLPAAGVLLIGFVEGLAAAKQYATRYGYDIDANRELLALGAANMGSSVIGGMVVNGSLSKTAVNGAAGARTQVSNLLVAALTILTLLLLTGLFEALPEAVLAAVVIVAVIELVDFPSLRRLYQVWSTRLERIYHRTARADFIAAITTLLGVLVLDTLPGLLLGVVVSLLLLLYRSSRPHIARLVRQPNHDGAWVDAAFHSDLSLDERTLVLRIEGPIFFANSDHVRDQVRQLIQEHTQAVVIDAAPVASIDVTGASMLAQLERDLAAQNIRLYFARGIGQVRDVVISSPDTTALGQVYSSIDVAVAAALDPADEQPPADAPDTT